MQLRRRLLPGGVTSSLPDGHYAVRGCGGRCWDEQGNVYLDFVCGYGASILGHAHPEVNQVVAEQLQRGLLLPGPNPLYEQLTAVLTGAFPEAEQCLFLKTGSEAVAAAIRLARAFTGKDRIIRCGFHGWHDQVIDPYISWHQYVTACVGPQRVAGIPASGLRELVLNWDGEDLNQLHDLFKKYQGEVAALVFDPVQLREPLMKRLRELRELTQNHNALLILDEAKTALRVHLAGVQGLYRVVSDLTVLSKSLANGFPLSAVLGPVEILGLAGSARIMGTFNGELASFTAALQTLSIMAQPESVNHLEKLGRRFIDGTNNLLARHRLAEQVLAVPYRWPCMPYLWFRKPSTQDWRLEFYRQMATCGVLLLPHHMNFLCLAHTLEDIDEMLQAMNHVLIGCSVDWE